MRYVFVITTFVALVGAFLWPRPHTPITHDCLLRWGGQPIYSFGHDTEQQCYIITAPTPTPTPVVR